MRFVMMPLSQGGKGHVFRDLLLAKELLKRNHEVVFACGENMHGLVKQEDIDIEQPGFELRSLIELDEKYFDTEVVKPFDWHDEESIRDFVEEELKLLEETEPDVVIGDLRFTAKLSAKIAGIPFAVISYAVYQDFIEIPTEVAESIVPVPVGNSKNFLRSVNQQAIEPYNKVLGEYGDFEKMVGFFDLFKGDLTLLVDLEELYSFSQEQPANAHFVGPFMEERSSEASLPDWFVELKAKEKPIILCLAGVMSHRQTVKTAVESFSDTDFQVIFTSGLEAFDGELEANGDNFYFVDYINQFEEVLNHCSLVIFPGSAETAYRALRSQVPMVFVPRLFANEYLAHQMEQNGLGKKVEGKKLDSEQLKSVTTALMGEQEIKDNLNEYCKKLNSYSGLTESAELLENFCDSSA